MNMREHAESLARQGFRVLPLHTPEVDLESNEVFCSCRQPDCKSIGKHPRNKQGSSEATTDLAKIGEWWSMWPDSNIGVATGYEFDVVDIDGEPGRTIYGEYCERFGAPAMFRIVDTGRVDGQHLYVKPGGLKAWTGGFGGHPIGLDVKGKGGYVVAPPSLHESGRRYSIGHDGPFGETPWPEWHRLVCADVAPVRVRQPSATASTGIGFAGTVKDRITREIITTPEGGRWQAFATVGIWDVARLINGGEISEADGANLLAEIAETLGLDEREKSRIVPELARARENAHTPIQRRAVPETPAAVSSAVSGDPGGQNSPLDAAERERIAVEAQTAYYRVQMKARDAAKDELRREQIESLPEASFFGLDEFLALPIDATSYRLDKLWPIGGRVVLAAQFKAGKTTFVGNVVRSLADGSPFLGRYISAIPSGTVGVLDTEMSPRQLQAWLRDQAVGNVSKVWVAPLRGKVASFDITDSTVRKHWAEHLRKRDTEVLVVDCLGPILAACGLDENTNQDIGKFLSSFEAMLDDASITDALVVHHMGHHGERSRGASRLRDWPDVEWSLIRDGQEDETTDVAPDAPRFFRAFGRDVNVPEQLLHFDPAFRWLSVNGDGSRKNVRANRVTLEVESFIKENPGATTRAIEAAVTGKAVYIRSSIRDLIAAGTVVTVDGPKLSKMHFHKDYVPENASGA